MSFLLDTSVISELRKPNCDEQVASWASNIAKREAFVSVVSIRELEAGVLAIERRDSRQGALLRSWLDDHVVRQYSDRLLPIDLAVARSAAALHVPDPRPERDALIGATALVHGLIVATRDVADFRPMGLRVVNPWGSPEPGSQQ